MGTSEFAQANVTIMHTWRRTALCTGLGRRRDLIAIRSAFTRTRWAVVVMATEVTQPQEVPRLAVCDGAFNACSWR